MRLAPTEIEEIRACAKRHFGERAVVRLFGSRTDDGRSGGDIDLHIEAESAEHATLANELEFSKDMKDRIGEQRVDVIVRAPPLYVACYRRDCRQNRNDAVVTDDEQRRKN